MHYNFNKDNSNHENVWLLICWSPQLEKVYAVKELVIFKQKKLSTLNIDTLFEI